MNVELIDRLRCPASHADSWLVAHARESADRCITEGTLGCPVCRREYAIRQGETWFGDAELPIRQVDAVADREWSMRLAALLNVDARGGIYLLGGLSALMLFGLPDYSDTARFLLLSPPEGPRADGTIRGAGDMIPLASGCLRGAVIDRRSRALATEAVRVIAPGGRLVAPADLPLPHGVRELARDGRQWVAERDAGFDPASLVTPRRAPPRTEHR